MQAQRPPRSSPGMTTLLEPIPSNADRDFSGLTAVDAARVAEAIFAERAPSTLASYASAGRLFVRWCTDRGLASLPADPATVCAYLAERAERGLANATITACCAAIGYEHQRAGVPDPTVARLRRGLRRVLGVAACRQARALLTEDTRSIVDQIELATCRTRHGRRSRRCPAGQDRRPDRHKEISTLVRHYIRPLDAMANTSNRSLGLQAAVGPYASRLSSWTMLCAWHPAALRR